MNDRISDDRILSVTCCVAFCHFGKIKKDTFKLKPVECSVCAVLPCDYSRLGIIMSPIAAYQKSFSYMNCKFRYMRFSQGYFKVVPCACV